MTCGCALCLFSGLISQLCSAHLSQDHYSPGHHLGKSAVAAASKSPIGSRGSTWHHQDFTHSCLGLLGIPQGRPQRAAMLVSAYLARRLSAAAPHTSAWQCAFQSTRAKDSQHRDVPAGHQHSDLRPAVSHIGLNRRRDLSLRNDVTVFRGNECVSLREWLRVRELQGPVARLAALATGCGIVGSWGHRSKGGYLQGGTSVIFGLPDMGKACSELHAPGFIKRVRSSIVLKPRM